MLDEIFEGYLRSLVQSKYGLCLDAYVLTITHETTFRSHTKVSCEFLKPEACVFLDNVIYDNLGCITHLGSILLE
jgi:hypothetical protein